MKELIYYVRTQEIEKQCQLMLELNRKSMVNRYARMNWKDSDQDLTLKSAKEMMKIQKKEQIQDQLSIGKFHLVNLTHERSFLESMFLSRINSFNSSLVGTQFTSINDDNYGYRYFTFDELKDVHVLLSSNYVGVKFNTTPKIVDIICQYHGLLLIGQKKIDKSENISIVNSTEVIFHMRDRLLNVNVMDKIQSYLMNGLI